jgi:DNA-binding response OmpR family regulator/DNA-binding MarR family transcriptional regulator
MDVARWAGWDMSEEVLLLDDDDAMLGILEGVLQSSGYRCASAQRADAALALIAERPQIAVVVSDIMMPGTNGLEFVDRLNALGLNHTPPRVLLLTARPTLERAVDALRLGVRDFLVKPVRPPELIDAVGRAMAQAREDRRASQLRSPQVQQLIRNADELAMRLRTLALTAPEAASQAPDQIAPAGVRMSSPPAEVAFAARHEDAPGLAVLDTIERLRRLRLRYEQHKLDDVAWELLLELLRAERLRQRLSVSGLAISISGVSATTALRRINELAAREYIERIADPDDARRDFVVLTTKSQALLSDYLAQANVYVSALTG